MFGVVLARLGRVVRGVGRMTMRRMGVMAGLFMMIRLVMLGGLAVMPGSVLVMLGGAVVMLDDLLLGHRDLHQGERRTRSVPAA